MVGRTGASSSRTEARAAAPSRQRVDELVVEGVVKSYGTGARGTPRHLALAGVSLSVSRGRFVAVLGPSGCGKSTLLRLVAGLIEPDAGSISIFGESPRIACARKHVGFLAQSPALLPWRSVLGNVRLALELNRRASARRGVEPEELLAAVGLLDARDRYPHELSGGMQQRVALARAFAYDPAVLLMDEPFSALDELTRRRLCDELLALWERDRKTVLFVTHSVPEAILLSDAIVVMAGRPGRPEAVVPVGLPRPRPDAIEEQDEFHAIAREVRAILRAGGGAGGRG